VASGQHRAAIATGYGAVVREHEAESFTPEIDAKIDSLERQPGAGVGEDFLRWMLSTSGAALLEDAPPAKGIGFGWTG